MTKDIIKRIPIKEEFIYIADHYVDLGKVIHVHTDKEFIRFQFLGKEEIVFQPPILTDKSGHYSGINFPEHIPLNEKEFDILFNFVKQRFGGKELK